MRNWSSNSFSWSSTTERRHARIRLQAIQGGHRDRFVPYAYRYARYQVLHFRNRIEPSIVSVGFWSSNLQKRKSTSTRRCSGDGNSTSALRNARKRKRTDRPNKSSMRRSRVIVVGSEQIVTIAGDRNIGVLRTWIVVPEAAAVRSFGTAGTKIVLGSRGAAAGGEISRG